MSETLPPVLDDAFIPELPSFYRGKVRDNYDLPDGRRILITTDRLSAFDRNLTAIPCKGQVLNQAARYWFEITADLCPNHVLEYPDPNVVIARWLEILPVEIVVRGYLAGTTDTSVLTMYQAGQREMYGIRLPDGMQPNQRLDAPIITATTKASDGGHDAPLSPADIIERGLLSRSEWDEVSSRALALFARGQQIAAKRGLILADTKYEFGTDNDGKIRLADEIHTPDSSRYWMAASYEERLAQGQRPESFDKDFVRSWVRERCDPYHDPIPEIPLELVRQTAGVYIHACEMITGKPFVMPPLDQPPLERIRKKLAALING